MLFSDPLILVALLALAYILVNRFLMSKLVDKKFMTEYHKKMAEMNKRVIEATKKNDVKELERLHEIQKKTVVKDTSKMLIEQAKMFAIIIILFSIALSILPILDPTTKDDLVVDLNPNDSFSLNLTNKGIYWIEVIENGRSKAKLVIGVEENGSFVNETEVDGGLLFTPKKYYSQGENLTIYYTGEKPIKIRIDMGTRIALENIPIFGRIEGDYWVFIFFIFIISIVLSLLKAIYDKIFSKQKKE